MLFIIEHNYDIGNIIVGDLDQFFGPARARDISEWKIFQTKMN